MATSIWQARESGWKIALRCDRRREGLKSVRPCQGVMQLHLSSLIACMGPEVTLEDLQKRLRCPLCVTDRFELQLTRPPAADSGKKDEKPPRRRMRPATQLRETLGSSREPWIIFECGRCGRRGEYRREHLLKEFDSTISLAELLQIFAHSRGCGLAAPRPTSADLARGQECRIRYDVEPLPTTTKTLGR